MGRDFGVVLGGTVVAEAEERHRKGGEEAEEEEAEEEDEEEEEMEMELSLGDEEENILEQFNRVQARFQGGDIYPGHIAKVNSDGTFDIQFDDGDFETKVCSLRVLL